MQALAHARDFALRLAVLASLPVLAPAASAQGLEGVDLSGTWRVKIQGSFDDTTFLPPHFKLKDVYYLKQTGSDITGVSRLKLGKCGWYLVPITGSRSGTGFTFLQVSPVVSFFDCSEVGSTTLDGAGVLNDGARANVAGSGYLDALFIQSGLSFAGTLQRISGMQTPDDPDGDGPGVPVSQIGSGEPGSGGANDLAVTALKAPKSVKSNAGGPAPQLKLSVRIQNRSQHAEVIADAAMLEQLVTLEAAVASGTPGTVAVQLHAPAPGKFPLLLKPRQKLNVHFLAAFSASLAGDAASTPAATLSWTARVDHAALAGALPDEHPIDDVAPRGVIAPFTFDTYPDGKIRERGVGAKKPDKTFGDPVLTAIIQSG